MLIVEKAKHRTIELDGVKLFYREAGRRDAPGTANPAHHTVSATLSAR